MNDMTPSAQRKSPRRALFLLIGILLLSFVAGCGSVFFYPSKQLWINPALQVFPHEDVYFKTTDGLTLHGWFFQAPDARGSTLVFHGNAENLSTHVNSVLWLVKEGYNVFIIDYRGYGLSEGKPSIGGVHLDAAAALETLFSMPGTDPDRVVVLGQSIGGSIAVYAVAHSPHKERIRALVIDSAFSSYRMIAREKLNSVCLTWPFQYPLSWTITDRYSAVTWIAKVSPVPVLILRDLEDPIVPAHHGKLLFDAAGEPKDLWTTSAPGHIRSFADASVRRQLLAYLARVLPPKRPFPSLAGGP